LPPILPLFLIELDTPTSQLATITGFVVAAGAIAAACSSMLYGRWARPERSRTLLVIALGGGAVFSAVLATVQNWPQVVVVRIILGLLAGGTMSLAYTMGARLVPPSRSGFMLSMLSSGGQFGGAVSPIMVGLVSQISLSVALLANAGAYLVALALAALPGTGRVPAPDPDAADTEPEPVGTRSH
jgi:MFS family permease